MQLTLNKRVTVTKPMPKSVERIVKEITLWLRIIFCRRQKLKILRQRKWRTFQEETKG